MKKQLLYILTIILVFSGCERFESGSANDKNPLVIYKFKNVDYSNNVPVILDQNKNEIVASRGAFDFDTAFPVKITNGYFISRDFINSRTAYLSLTYAEYKAIYKIPFNADTLKDLIIEKDPFIELYSIDKLQNEFIISGGGYHNLDTTKINEIIRQGRIEEYFKKII